MHELMDEQVVDSKDPIMGLLHEFILYPTSMTIASTSSRIDEIRIESRYESLVIHNTENAPSLNVCTLMKTLLIDRETASKVTKRAARGKGVYIRSPRGLSRAEDPITGKLYFFKRWTLSRRG